MMSTGRAVRWPRTVAIAVIPIVFLMLWSVLDHAWSGFGPMIVALTVASFGAAAVSVGIERVLVSSSARRQHLEDDPRTLAGR